jgi:hypothetical protein
VHEIENHERSFDYRDSEGDDGIQGPGKIVEGGEHSESGSHHQQQENRNVNSRLDYVLTHTAEVRDQKSEISQTRNS